MADKAAQWLAERLRDSIIATAKADGGWTYTGDPDDSLTSFVVDGDLDLIKIAEDVLRAVRRISQQEGHVMMAEIRKMIGDE